MGAADWKRVLAADYTPDMPPFENPGSGLIRNAIPITPNAYAPFPTLLPAGGSGLTLACQGAYSCLDSSDNVYVFAGDQQNLYEYTAASSSPVKVSYVSSSYNCASDALWHFTIFAGRVLATDYEAPIQSFVLGSSSSFAPVANGSITSLALVGGTGYTPGTYALAVSNAGIGTGFTGTVTVSSSSSLSSYVISAIGKDYPQTATIVIPGGAGGGSAGSIKPAIQTIAPFARYIAVVKNFLCVANTNDPVNAAQPQCVWWSADNDPTNWPTPGTSVAAQYQSSYNNLYGDGGMIQGIVGNLGTADGAVIMEHAVWTMLYVGPPDVFNFYPAQGVRGSPAPGSIAQLGALVYYLGEDGFYSFDGSQSNPIGANRVDKTFYADVDCNSIGRMCSAVDPINRMIYWAYSSTQSTNGVLDKILGYNWEIDKWTGILNASAIEILFRAYTFGNDVLDNVGSVSLDTASYQVYPMDSVAWTGGNIALGGFLSSNNQFGYFNGVNNTATIETTEIQLFPGKRAQIKNTRPLADVSGGNSTLYIKTRDTLYATPVVNGNNKIGYLGTSPLIANGRYARAGIVLSTSDTWTKFQGIEIEASESGAY